MMNGTHSSPHPAHLPIGRYRKYSVCLSMSLPLPQFPSVRLPQPSILSPPSPPPLFPPTFAPPILFGISHHPVFHLLKIFLIAKCDAINYNTNKPRNK